MVLPVHAEVRARAGDSVSGWARRANWGEGEAMMALVPFLFAWLSYTPRCEFSFIGRWCGDGCIVLTDGMCMTDAVCEPWTDSFGDGARGFRRVTCECRRTVEHTGLARECER